MVWSRGSKQGKGKGRVCTPNVSQGMGRHRDTWMEGVMDSESTRVDRNSEICFGLCICPCKCFFLQKSPNQPVIHIEQISSFPSHTSWFITLISIELKQGMTELMLLSSSSTFITCQGTVGKALIKKKKMNTIFFLSCTRGAGRLVGGVQMIGLRLLDFFF